MHQSSEVITRAADFHWLAFLLTDSHDLSVEIAVEAVDAIDDSNPYFSAWMLSWARRLVIAKALAKVRDQVADSARRTESMRPGKLPSIPRDWKLDPQATKTQLQEALLAIDLFPRAALLLSMFEGMALDDAAVLLDVHPDLVRKGRAIALRQLTSNLAGIARPARRRNDIICRMVGSNSRHSTYGLTHFVPLKP
jgi:DNA-directed RNA polymerase specialized sigma24 family protein